MGVLGSGLGCRVTALGRGRKGIPIRLWTVSQGSMPRMHLFELQDQPGFPAVLGDAGTAYLRTLSDKMGAADFLGPVVAEALDRSGATAWVDLCSGAGGPAPQIAQKIGRSVILSDLKPNRDALAQAAREGATVHADPVDAAAVPPSLGGLRTLFNAFHHFGDETALAVLQDAVAAGQPIAIVELSERSVPSVLSAAFIPLLVWLVMPFVRPVRLSWLLLTYVLPVLPWTIAWDGLVSHLRTRNPDELRALCARLDAPGWTFEARRQAVKGPAGFTLLLALPPGSAPAR